MQLPVVNGSELMRLYQVSRIACVLSFMSCRSHTCIKELVQGQTFQRLLGYVFKDEGKSHFRNHLFGGITRAEVDAGKEEWTSLKLDYMQSKVALNMSTSRTSSPACTRSVR